MAKQKNKDSEDSKSTPQETTQNLLNSLLNGYEDDHFNYIPNNPLKVSTGSLILDQEVNLTEGVHRFVGFTGSGKTSEALLVLKNFLDADPTKRKGFLVKAEGRLSDNVVQRSGIKFVFKADEWQPGTCFVLESNILESISMMLEALIKAAYSSGIRLGIIIDSIDALRLKADMEKDIGSEKVSGPQGIIKRFLTRVALPIQKYGCMCICISQVSSNIKIDPYSKEPPRITSGGGGFGLMHFANYILEFEARYAGDNILEDPSKKFDQEKNKIVGHWSTVTIKKSDKENEFTKIKYPIKHGRQNGNSIWVEYEIVDVLLMWGLLNKGGAWLKFQDSLIQELKDNNLVLEPQHQGIENLRLYLEANPEITKYLFNKLHSVLSK